MVFNILLLHKNKKALENIKDAILKNKTYDKTTLNVEIADSLYEPYDLIKRKYFNIIFGDFEIITSDSYGLFALPISTTIYSLKKDRSQNDLFEESILRGATPLIGDIESTSFIESKILPIFDEKKYKDSYSNLLIDSLLEMNSSNDIANLMSSYAKAACKRFEIDGLKRSDIIRVLSLLSVSIKNRSLFKTIRFFEQMRIADELLDLTHQFLEPYSIEAYIIHTIYHHTKIDILGLDHNSCRRNSVPQEIHDEIVDIIKEHKVFINKGLDIEAVWVKLIDALNDMDIDTQTYDAFIKVSNELSRRSIFYYQGAFISINKAHNSSTYSISPVIHMDESELDDIIKDIDVPKTVEIKRDDKGFKIVVHAKALEDKEDISESQSTKTYIQKPLNKRDLISANEYMESLDNLDDVLDSVEMLEGYEDLAEKIILQTTDSISKAQLEQASEILIKYSQLLGMQDSFKNLSYVILTLSSILKAADENKLEQNNKMIATMLSSMIDDLRSWKTTLFISRTTQDIHYLDDSLYSSCLQIEKLLSTTISHGDEDDDDDELELF
ncbi:MAG: hypothetical protein ACOC08_01875 [Campylobacterales bacterium]